MNTDWETLTHHPANVKASKSGGRLKMGEGIRMVSKPPMKLSGRRSQEKKYKWTRYEYQEQLELAKLTRNALLAVLAELHRLHFLAWDKKAPIGFGTSILRSLGFNAHDNTQSLQPLQQAVC